MTSSDQIGAAVDAAIERFGAVDVLVNNAGYGSVGAVEEIDMDDLRVLMDTMFFGAVAMTQAVLPRRRSPFSTRSKRPRLRCISHSAPTRSRPSVGSTRASNPTWPPGRT